jgi:hypothetical protein
MTSDSLCRSSPTCPTNGPILLMSSMGFIGARTATATTFQTASS